MKTDKIVFYLFIVLALISFGQIIYFYNILPASIASRFNRDGMPTLWFAKKVFILIHAGLVLLTSGFFLFVGLFLERIPAKFLNIPNKDHWMAPDRKQQTFNDFLKFLYLYANMTLVFFFMTFQHIYKVNLNGFKDPEGDTFYLTLLFVSASGILAVAFFRRFMNFNQ
jgi:uncharacterized membrane protein